ncbi:MAG: ABC transporter permease, partial [Akkermansiaceae bacterium]
ILDAEEKHGYDVGVMHAYLRWLGVMPKEKFRSKAEFAEGATETKVLVSGTTYEVTVTDQGELKWGEGSAELDKDAWKARIITVKEIERRWRKRTKSKYNPEGLAFPKDKARPQAVVYQSRWRGLLQGDLQRSTKYGDRISDMMKERFPISLFYGILSMIIIYSVCLPLGIIKAIKHRSFMDTFSSVTVFCGYAIPSYVLGAFLLWLLGFHWDLLPQEGFVSENFDTLSTGGKIKDLIEHAIMPLSCYLVGSFAMMTMMMKNNLMDNLAADYVRTATAKGVPYRRAVFKHAFRNSLIPIATTFGQNITLIIGGSFLIEKIFDINGFGLMQYTAVLDRDEPVILGVLVVAASLQLLGNILSDVCVAIVDPRISYK